MCGSSIQNQICHAKKLISQFFSHISVDSVRDRLQYVQSLGCSQTAVVYEGLYGIGFQVVKQLCLMGVEKILILSQFSISKDTQKRFSELEGYLCHI